MTPSPARALAEAVYEDVLGQISGEQLVEKAVRRVGKILFIQDRAIDLEQFQRIRIAGAGKASVSMAEALSRILDTGDGLVISKDARSAPAFDVVVAGHPVPDSRSISAGRRMLEFARSCDERDLVVFCLSGGASALMEALTEGVTLTDLQETTSLLLSVGAPIQTINAIRTTLSSIKGGRLSSAFGAATVVVLVLSDVVGSDLSVVGSGPLFQVNPRELSAQASTAHRFALQHENRIPRSVFETLISLRLPVDSPRREHFVIGSPALLVPLACDAARRHGLEPMPYADQLAGEARLRAHRIVRLARAKVAAGERRFCMIFAGETTVHLRQTDQTSKGGRCQEMALAAAIGLRHVPSLAFLAGATDGTDGPTDATGGVVDHGSVSASNLSPRVALAHHSSYDWLESAGSLLRSGPTGSNLTDLVLVVQHD